MEDVLKKDASIHLEITDGGEAVLKKEESTYEKVCAYFLLWWDGTGFFGLNTSKLKRIKGEKVTFCT